MPNEFTSNRKLAAILFADVVGYTALMQKDEAAATKWLRRFQDSVKELVSSHNGQIVNFYGDGALCTFNNPLEAMRCAIELQSGFQSEPKVPVRIGIHSGTVVTEGDKVYGDSVNVASRIESMGIPGAILVSKKVRDELKNQPDLLMPSHGSFEFKNVEEPMEVFALANEGFAVPRKDQMKGKLKLPQDGKSRLLLPFGVLIALVLAVGYWMKNSNANLNLNDRANLEPLNTPIAKKYRDERVAVLVFENKTGSEDLEDFGSMVSDWITRGLMETGDAKVISAANIQDKIQLASMGPGDFAKLSQSTGVGVVVQGRYYLQEDQLIIHANVVGTDNGQVIHALEPIQGPKSDMMKLLNELTEEILGYWSVRDQSRFAPNPPKYEAYQLYQEVQLDWGNREKLEEIEYKLSKAYELDNTFLAPLLKLVVHYNNPGGDRTKRDSLFQYIERSNLKFTEWEHLRYEGIKSSAERNWLKFAQTNERMYEMDPSDGNAHYNSIWGYIRANYPRKAIEIYESWDYRYENESNFEGYDWSEGRAVEAFFRNGDYDGVIQLALDYPYQKMMTNIANIHMESLIRLDSLEALEKVFTQYSNMDLYNFGGRLANTGHLFRSICAELYLLDNKLELEKWLDRFKEWTEKDQGSSDFNMAHLAFFQGDYNTALNHFVKIDFSDRIDLWPYMNHSKRVGVCHALNGDTLAVQNLLEELSKVDDFPELMAYNVGVIYTAMGDREKALDKLRESIDLGYSFLHNRWQRDIFLKSLHNDPEFQELVKPKG